MIIGILLSRASYPFALMLFNAYLHHWQCVCGQTEVHEQSVSSLQRQLAEAKAEVQALRVQTETQLRSQEMAQFTFEIRFHMRLMNQKSEEVGASQRGEFCSIMASCLKLPAGSVSVSSRSSGAEQALLEVLVSGVNSVDEAERVRLQVMFVPMAKRLKSVFGPLKLVKVPEVCKKQTRLMAVVMQARIAQLERELAEAEERGQQTENSKAEAETVWRKAMEEANTKVERHLCNVIIF